MTRHITNQAGTEISFDAAVELMDDELREKLHAGDGDPTGSNDRPGSEQQFFEWYCRLHRERFGEEFEPNKRNPVWRGRAKMTEQHAVAMTDIAMPEIRVGDRLRFKVACRDGIHTATRKVNGFYLGKPTVRFFTHDSFVLNAPEINRVLRGDETIWRLS